MRSATPRDPMDIFFFDNTDPDGFDRVFAKIGNRTRHTLVGRDLEIRRNEGNAQRNAGSEGAFRKGRSEFRETRRGGDGRRAASWINTRRSNGWLARFPMHDWVGGRTSVMSAVGLLPAALQGFDIDEFLAGAAAMDAHTRAADTRQNAAMLLALMWYYAGDGRGEKGHGDPALQRSARAFQQISCSNW